MSFFRSLVFYFSVIDLNTQTAKVKKLLWKKSLRENIVKENVETSSWENPTNAVICFLLHIHFQYICSYIQ